MRKFLLYLSRSHQVRRWAEKWGESLGVGRFVAGESIDEAISRIKELNQEGFSCTLDHLGENTVSLQGAQEATETCKIILHKIQESQADCNLSLKLTQLGLDVDPVLCEENLREILDEAEKRGNFVRIDMEDYSHCQITLDMFHRLAREYNNVGVVIQAYLYRSLKDVNNLKDFSLRLVKGAYLEPETVAFKTKKDVDEQFKQMICLHLRQGAYSAIATHDEKIIDFIKQWIEKEDIPKDRYEFQMLFGIRPGLQKEIRDNGDKMRIYVPFGKDWYGYFMRRLAERPANLWFVIKGTLKK